ncbi:HSP90 family protein [Actinomadura sp. 9N407]|uniref:HSP90 family protein n=1 Tax=Actinomadura sp. 9N407 TaxID=3375154 RepID=UPI003796153E
MNDQERVADEHGFRVDLRGIVDLLSRHLYSSPRVYVRELLQNAVDAITARATVEGSVVEGTVVEGTVVEGTVEGAVIRIETGDALRVHDPGIGLTEEQVHELLATIGRSSKRDELGFSRSDFLGQFGIGLLSCFLVADEIEVLTRSATGGHAVRWRGHAEGRYTVERSERNEPGTTVTLRPRRDLGHWLEESTVRELVRHYGSYLPYEVRLNDVRIDDGDPPWETRHDGPGARRDALLRHGTTVLGTVPFDAIDLDVPEAGLRGVAYVLPRETNPSDPPKHRVYLRRMLVGDRVEKVLPDWAFFVRCVVDATELRPTASREQLYDDGLLTTVRDRLGEQIRGWLVRTSVTEPERLRAFLDVHYRGVLALAVHDVEMLRIVDEWIPFDTGEGQMPLTRFRARHRDIRYTLNVEEFQQYAGIAAAQGIGLVNGGYTYYTQVLQRLRLLDPELVVRRLDPADLATRFDRVDSTVEFAARDFLAVAERTLKARGCVPALRSFAPTELPVLFLAGGGPSLDPPPADSVWAEFTEEPAEQVGRTGPTLVFNHRNPLVARLTTTARESVVALAVEAMYGYALLTGRRAAGPADVAAMNRAFLGLVEHAVESEG